jgi:LysM repeat protein
MKSVQQLLLGLISAVGTSLLVLGAFSLALAEDSTRIAAVLSTVPAVPSPSATTSTGDRPAITLTASATLPPIQPTACPTPAGWVPYVIQPGDTLEALAEAYGLTPAKIRSMNCLSGITLIPNAILHLPAVGPTLTASAVLPTPLPSLMPTFPPTNTPIPCVSPPPGWVPYVVRRGDTLFRLSIAYGISQEMLRIGNCRAGTGLIAGEILYVPNVITRTPAVTRTSVPPSATQEEATATSSDPTATNTDEPTATVTPEPTETPSPTHTPPDTATAITIDPTTPSVPPSETGEPVVTTPDE